MYSLGFFDLGCVEYGILVCISTTARIILLCLISNLSLEEAGIIENADHGHFDRKL